MNVIARLEYELAYCDSAVHRFNHYTTRTPPVWLRVDLGIMVMKRYFTLLKSSELEPHHQMQLNVILRALLFEGVALPFCRGYSQIILSLAIMAELNLSISQTYGLTVHSRRNLHVIVTVNLSCLMKCVQFFKAISSLSLSYIYKVKLATLVEGDPKAPLSIATTPRCRGGHYSFPWIAPLYS